MTLESHSKNDFHFNSYIEIDNDMYILTYKYTRPLFGFANIIVQKKWLLSITISLLSLFSHHLKCLFTTLKVNV